MKQSSLFSLKSIIIGIVLFFSVPMQTLNAQSYSDYQREKRIEQTQIKKEKTKAAYIGIAAFIGFCVIGLWLKKRQLVRTNKEGTEIYPGWQQFLSSQFGEGLANIIAVGLFIVAAIYFIKAC